MSDQGNILHEVDVEESVREDLEGEGQVGFTHEAIDDLDVSVALNSTFSDTEVEAAFLATNTAVNDILAVLRANGLVAESEE